MDRTWMPFLFTKDMMAVNCMEKADKHHHNDHYLNICNHCDISVEATFYKLKTQHVAKMKPNILAKYASEMLNMWH